MADDSLITLHIDELRASGTPKTTLRDRLGVLQRADASGEFEYGVEYASHNELVAYLGQPGIGGTRETRDRGWSSATRSVYHYHLSQFFAWAVSTGRLEFNPMAGIKAAKVHRGVPRPVSDDQLRTILATDDDLLYTISLFAAGAGLRCCEIAELDRDDVTERTTWIRGKGDRRGVVDTHPVIWATVEPLPSGNIVAQLGARPNARYVSNYARAGYAKLGLHRVGPHRLRAWHGTGVLDHRGNLLAAASALRHASVATTQRYALLRNPERRAAIDALPVIRELPHRRLAG